MSKLNIDRDMLDVRTLGEAIGCGDRDALNIAEDLIEMAYTLEAILEWAKKPAIGANRRRFGSHPDSINQLLLDASSVVNRYKEPSNG